MPAGQRVYDLSRIVPLMEGNMNAEHYRPRRPPSNTTCVDRTVIGDNAIVFPVDEKPSIQALERRQGYLKLPDRRPLRQIS